MATRRCYIMYAACTIPLAVQPATAQTKTADAQKSTVIEDVVVTSQRRSQKLQNVPIAVTAFTARQLEARNVTSTADLMKVTPGLQFGQGDLQRNELSIRGIESNRFDAGGDPASATFVDDVYQPRFSNLFLDLIDVDRIEVLKGPQGTLYGRNTIGGAVAIYTPVPGPTFHALARADVGSNGLYGGQFALSGPLSDDLDGSFAGGYRHRDGFMKDLSTGDTNGIESFGGRGKLLWHPTEPLKITLAASYFDNKQNAVVFHRITDQVFLLQPGIVPGVDNDVYTNRLSYPTGEQVRTASVSGRVDYTTGDVALTSISAYQYTRDYVRDDQDASVYDAFGYTDPSHSNSASEELRAASVSTGRFSLGGRLTWVGGLYYFQERADEALAFRLGPDDLFTSLADSLGVPVPGNAIIDTTARAITTRSYAAFGQTTYAITKTLNFTFGARYTVDRKVFNVVDATNTQGFPLITSDFHVSNGKTWDKFTPKFVLDYRFVPQVLTYISYARGYQSGTPQSVAFNSVIADKIINPETVATLEVGAKTDLFNRRLRLNLAGFDSDFHNLQVRQILPINGVPQPVLQNAAGSRVEGIEAESSLAVTSQLRVNLGYNYLDAHYKNYVPEPGTDDSGNRLPRAPRHTVSMDGTYNWELPNGGTIASTVLEYVSTKIYFQPDNLPIESQSAYATTDLNFGYNFPNEKWRAAAFVKDVFDQKYRTYVELNAPSGRETWSDRRTFGFSLTYRL